MTAPTTDTSTPVETHAVPTADGRTTPAVVRRPPGPGRFPALIYLHGGLDTRPVGALTEHLRGETSSRFVEAGYVVVVPTFRSRRQDPITDDALEDCLAVVAWVKHLPGVDSENVFVWGDSGGGSLALELAGETSLRAIAVQEPATVLFTGVFSQENLGGSPPFSPEQGHHIMADPRRYLTPELEARTRAKIEKISCPILLVHGDVHPINRINHEIVIPELRRAGKDLTVIPFPGEKHGFTHRGTPEARLKFFQDADSFFRKHRV